MCTLSSPVNTVLGQHHRVLIQLVPEAPHHAGMQYWWCEVVAWRQEGGNYTRYQACHGKFDLSQEYA
jgi:hypothetical protein